ncbi:MAG: alpha/beta hydrolase [Nonlabens sp.]
MKTLFTFLFVAIFVPTAYSQSIQTTVVGDGDPVLLLAGFASTSDVWETIAEESLKNHELHLVDYAGFGKVPALESDFLETVRTDLREYVEELDSDKLTIIGHSMGGTFAAWLAAQPDLKIREIVIVDGLPASGALMFPGVDLSTLVYDSPYNNQMLEIEPAAFEQTLEYMIPGMATAPEHQAIIKQSVLETDRKTYVYGFTDYLKFDIREDLKNIHVPVTILGAGGMFGEKMATKTFRDQYINLERYNLIMHPTSKHFIMYDDPQWLNNQIAIVLKAK